MKASKSGISCRMERIWHLQLKVYDIPGWDRNVLLIVTGSKSVSTYEKTTADIDWGFFSLLFVVFRFSLVFKAEFL